MGIGLTIVDRYHGAGGTSAGFFRPIELFPKKRSYRTTGDSSVREWYLMFDGSLTSVTQTTSNNRNLSSIKSRALKRKIYSLNEQFGRLDVFFGLGKSELARIFSVSRPALYAWLSEESVPQGINADRIRRLHTLLEKVPWDGQHSLFHGYTTELLNVLVDTSSDDDAVEVLFKYLWEKTAERLKRVSAVPLKNEPMVDSRVLDDHLLSLGTEG